MKRYKILLIIVAMQFLFYGCTASEGSQSNSSVNFYYCTESISYNSVNGVISSEAREAEGYTDSIEHLLSLYIKGPVTSGFVSPFPNGLQIEAFTVSSNRVQVTLNSAFSELTGIDMTLACACLAKTIQELVVTDYLYISYDNSATGKRQTITVGPDTFLLLDYSTSADNMEE